MRRRRSHNRRVAELRRLPALAHVPARRLARLAPLFDEVEFAAGDVLVREGAPGFDTFLILRGRAELSVAGAPVAVLEPGDLAGELALVDAHPRAATVTALTPVSALVAGAAAFPTLVADPAFARAVLASYARRLHHAGHHLAGTHAEPA